MSTLITGVKAILFVTLLAMAGLWLDEKVGPGYSTDLQQRVLQADSTKADDNPPTTPESKPESKPETKPESKAKPEANAEPKPEPQAKTEKPQAKLNGIDISHFQGDINWQVLAKDDLDFIFVKATGGETYIDPKFAVNWHSLRTINIARGAYHFFYAADDAKKQAENFLNTVGKLKPTDLPPVLDIEISDHTKAEELLEGVLTWLETVEEQTERRPIIYTGISFGQQFLNDEKLSKYPLWIAEYSKTLSPLPIPWKENGWTFWQHSQSGHVLGINGNVDQNIFAGDKQKFSEFIKSTIID